MTIPSHIIDSLETKALALRNMADEVLSLVSSAKKRGLLGENAPTRKKTINKKEQMRQYIIAQMYADCSKKEARQGIIKP